MKLDFNFKPAAEMPASEALRPAAACEQNAPHDPLAANAPVSEIGLLARRSTRLARRASR